MALQLVQQQWQPESAAATALHSTGVSCAALAIVSLRIWAAKDFVLSSQPLRGRVQTHLEAAAVA